MRFILHVCGLRDIPLQTRLIEYEGLESVEELANYTDSELDSMADRNSKRSPAATRVLMGLARTKKLKAVKFWVNKKLREDAPCDLTELNDAKIAQLIREMSLVKEGKESDSKLYFPWPCFSFWCPSPFVCQCLTSSPNRSSIRSKYFHQAC